MVQEDDFMPGTLGPWFHYLVSLKEKKDEWTKFKICNPTVSYVSTFFFSVTGEKITHR